MCGICGFIGTGGQETLERMTGLLKHRGPDDFGYYRHGTAHLGCRRLSIIDLAGGHMPLFDESGARCVIQNGEIYNYRELRQTLQDRGHVFRTQSDTEVIVHAYEEYGDEFCRELNGDFAIAIWDDTRQALLLARDRFGVHPLYYTETADGLVFASELKSLLAHPRVARQLDPCAVDLYLTLRYVPRSQTLFKNIHKLPPATCLIHRQGQTQIRTYWRLPDAGDASGPAALEPAAEHLAALLEDSVKLRMRSDVPVGAYLSGGVDSGTIVGLMTHFTSQPVQTFCIGFGTHLDEFAESEALARAFGANHHEIVLGKHDFELLPRIVWHLDEPIGDAITIPTFRLAQEAAREVKVVLSGEGADEVWAGYIHHLVMETGGRLRRVVPAPLLRAAAALLEWAPAGWVSAAVPYPAAVGQQGKQVAAQYLRTLASGGLAGEYQLLASLFRPPEKPKLYTPEFLHTLPSVNHFGDLETGGGTRLDRIIRFDMRHWLADYTLLRQDKLGFASSLEIRVPYLDHRIAEFAATLPDTFKIRGRSNKRLLRRAAERTLPAERAHAPKKAFYIPTEKVFGKEFDDYVRGVLGSAACRRRGILAPAWLDQCLASVRSGELVRNKQIVALTILELWFRTYVDGDGSAPVTV